MSSSPHRAVASTSDPWSQHLQEPLRQRQIASTRLVSGSGMQSRPKSKRRKRPRESVGPHRRVEARRRRGPSRRGAALQGVLAAAGHGPHFRQETPQMHVCKVVSFGPGREGKIRNLIPSSGVRFGDMVCEGWGTGPMDGEFFNWKVCFVGTRCYKARAAGTELDASV